LIAGILARFDELIRARTLIIDRESGFTEVVETTSGNTVETLLLAYPTMADIESNTNGIFLGDSIFYQPDKKELVSGFDCGFFWGTFCDLDDSVVRAWTLSEVKEHQPPQLNETEVGPDAALEGLSLIKFLFELYQARLASE
jgi:hypothetical protein